MSSRSDSRCRGKSDEREVAVVENGGGARLLCAIAAPSAAFERSNRGTERLTVADACAPRSLLEPRSPPWRPQAQLRPRVRRPRGPPA